MRPSSSRVLDKLVDKFFGDSTSLYPELAADMTLLSGSTGIMGVTAGTSIGFTRFEFILPLLMAAGVALSGVLVLVSVWAVWAVPAQFSKVDHPAQLVRTVCVNSGTSG